MRKYFWLLVLLPLLELTLFGWLARAVGPLAPLACVMFSAAIGLSLFKRGQLRTLRQFQAAAAQGGQVPPQLAEELLRLGGSVLFIVPGLFTDLLGALLFVPPVRRLVAARLRRGRTASVSAPSPAPADRTFRAWKGPVQESDAEIVVDAPPRRPQE